MSDIDRLKQLSGITESDERDVTLEKIKRGIKAYLKSDGGDHRWPFGFEPKMAEMILAELEKEDQSFKPTRWGERT